MYTNAVGIVSEDLLDIVIHVYATQVWWEGGRPADEIQVDFKILKLLYRFNYSEFYYV